MGGENIVLAVADGHGSNRHFRSQWGAQIAVRCAVETFGQVLTRLEGDDSFDFSQTKRILEIDLPKHLLRNWRDDVKLFHEKNSLAKEEFAYINKQYTPTTLSDLEKHINTIYGATLLAVFVMRNLIVFTQIGDGDILCIMETGEILQPIPEDSRIVLNETDSLSDPKAEGLMKLYFLPLTEWNPAPKMILVSSDGLRNSYDNSKKFRTFASGINAEFETGILKEQILHVETHLQQWLQEISHEGSGDDVTLGILFRPDAYQHKQDNNDEKKALTENDMKCAYRIVPEQQKQVDKQPKTGSENDKSY
jgi:serine/threonine protein phosphatase PrpC